jgi:hypothetical protein
MKLLIKSQRVEINFKKHFVVQAVTETNFDWNKKLLIFAGTGHQGTTNKSNKGKEYKVNNKYWQVRIAVQCSSPLYCPYLVTKGKIYKKNGPWISILLTI